MTERNFKTTSEEGNATEILIASDLTAHGLMVHRVPNDSELRLYDIDMFVSKNGLCFKSVEIKSDNRIAKTGNIAIEINMNRKTGCYPGWYAYCKADILCYFDSSNRIAYYLHWGNLRHAIEIGKFKIVQFDNKIDNCTGTLCLVPVRELSREILLSKRHLKSG